MTADLRVPRGKGAILIQTKRGIEREFGEAVLTEVIERCAPETQEVLKGVVLSTTFYPETVIGDFIAATVAVVGFDIFPPHARRMAQEQVNTIFKFLLRFFISARKLSENNHKLWTALHDTGELKVIHGADDRSHVVEISGFTFPTPEYERVFVEYHCGILELTGARNVRGVSQKIGPDRYHQSYTWDG